jgi:hypothetical protein
MPEPETDAVKVKARDLAARALAAAIRGEWQVASAIVRRMNAECGSEGTMIAVVGWCDTLTVRLGLDATKDTLALGFVDQDTGTRSMSTGVPQRTQWAGQLIMARARLDQPMFEALIDALPDDPKVVGSYVGAVLECVAMTLKEHEDA